MTLNVSRIKQFFTCRRKFYYNYVENVQGSRRSMNLVDGSAVHEGIAVGIATKDWTAAQASAKQRFAQDSVSLSILPEESYLLEQHERIVLKILDVFRENYETEQYTVLQPECEFEIAIGRHRLKGKTDAIVLWNGNIWLLEHKTTAISGQQFWSQWQLDIQPTAYIYGIWKSLNIKPAGFILNALVKPSEAQVAGWNKKRTGSDVRPLTDYIKYEREAFLRTNEDLLRFEKQFIAVADDIERSLEGGKDAFYMSPVVGACTAYNRLCDYYSLCTTHDDPSVLASLEKREPDYVDLSVQTLVQLSQSQPTKEPIDA